MKIQITNWAEYENGKLIPPSGTLPLQMVNSDATAQPLCLLDSFGADYICFPAGGEVKTHTHPGDHILIVVDGEGFVIYNNEIYELQPGKMYMVPGSVPHAIKATTRLLLMSIANDHRPADASSRLNMVKNND